MANNLLENISLENDEKCPDEDEKLKKTAWIHQILLNRTIRAVVLTAVIAICLPTFVYLIFYSRELSTTNYKKEYGTCGYYDIYHLPCGPKNISERICKLRGCCFMFSHGCYHALPSRHRYLTSGNVWSNDEALSTALKQTPLDGEMAIEHMKLVVNEINENVIEIRVVHSLNAAETTTKNKDDTHFTGSEKNYDVRVFVPSVYVEVYRKGTNVTLFSSAKGPWIASLNYFEWSMHLNADIMVGLGHHFLDEGQKYLLFNNKSNFAMPFVLGFNKKHKNYHAIYFGSESPLEVEIMDTKLILVRGFKSSLFRVYVLTGPTPKDIYTQIRALSDKHYTLKDYWHLGVHLCDDKSDGNLTQAISNLEKLLESKNYPFDSHCLQENLIWLTNKETLSSDARTVLDKLRAKPYNKRFIASVMTPLEVSESSAYVKAKEQNLLLTQASQPDTPIPYIGTANGKNVSYIDFTWPESRTWLNEFWSGDVINNISADGYLFQGTWLPDDSTFVPIRYELPYVPDAMNDTMRYLPPWNVKSRAERLLLKQNQIAEAQVNQMASNDAIKEKQMILTTTPSISVFGVSYKQNVSSTWNDFGKHVESLTGLSVGGFNLYGFPVCGDFISKGDNNEVVSEELCIRWYQFASVMPIFRLSSSRFVDNFSLYGQRTLINIIRRRYTLLEYMHSTLINNDLLLRPIIYDFPEQFEFAENFTNQFMIGDSLMVVPVMLPFAKYISIYFPDIFYELYGGLQLNQTRQRKPLKVVDYPIVLTDFPIFLRAGKIIALHNVQSSRLTADDARFDEFYLKIGLSCKSVGGDANSGGGEEGINGNHTRTCSASGILMFTEKTLWKFNVDNRKLSITVESNEMNEFDNLFCSDSAQISKNIAWADIYGLDDTDNTNKLKFQSKRIELKLDLCDFTLNEPKEIEF